MIRALHASLAGAAVLLVSAVTAGALASSCSQTPTNVPVRTFQSAQRMDYVCMLVGQTDPNDPTGDNIPLGPFTVPLAPDECAPAPPNADTNMIANHLFALVTQETHGEIAVVDLTGATIIDEDRSTPETNFIPVGQNPTDVVVAPDGVLSYVATAEPNKPAIYVIPNRRLLGGWQNAGGVPLTLTDLPVCALPQPAKTLSVVPRGGGAYDLVAVLPSYEGQTSKVVTIDVAPFLAGAAEIDGLSPDAAVPDAGVYPPGALAPCAITSSLELSGNFPSAWTPGPNWDDGVEYVDGGVDAPMPAAPVCGIAAIDAATLPEAGPFDAGTLPDGQQPLALGPLDPPQATASALVSDSDRPTLYVADGAIPVIHVIDLSNPAQPKELPPLLTTSVVDPGRRVAVAGLAVSPATRTFQRFLYAIDQKEGSVMVFDISDPNNSPRTPLQRPHPELTPQEPPDRISFGAPAAAVTFVKHDLPLPPGNDPNGVGGAYTGILCNPNPQAGSSVPSVPVNSSPEALGIYYRADIADPPIMLGPTRLRGVFAFVTLSSGAVVAIDVDDWDAPCRRPDPLSHGQVRMANGSGVSVGVTLDLSGPFSDIAPAETATAGDIGPYSAPLAFQDAGGTQPTTEEAFYPVSAPHRTRSNFWLRNDPTYGNHIPSLVGQPELLDDNNGSVATGTTGQGPQNPLMTATSTTLADPSQYQTPTSQNPVGYGLIPDPLPDTIDPLSTANVQPSIRLAWEDPLANQNQAWTVTYEGTLPAFTALPMNITTSDGYQTLTLSEPGGLLCTRGVEDWDIGKTRVALAVSAMQQAKLAPLPVEPDLRTADYIQIADAFLPNTDPYWSSFQQDCWEGDLAEPDNGMGRYNTCVDTFGPHDQTPELSVQRDFPILQAFDDHLVIGQYAYPANTTPTTANRVVAASVGATANPSAMKLMRCCFHSQASFNVRTGGEWVAVGSMSGYLHHMIADASTQRCVLSCDPKGALLNGRVIEAPRATPVTPIDRNNPLALRNQGFSFVIWSGAAPTGTDLTTSQRNLVWKFSISGAFVPQAVNIATGTTAVAPQSMKFLEPIGQLAVVDGSSQGLVTIDLNTVLEAHTPFF